MKVLYIDIDSLRPDHVGAYGYEGGTTPNIDSFAEEAVTFRRAYAANSPCMPARAAFLSGRYGINNGIVTHGARSQVLNSPAAWDGFTGNRQDWWTVPELFFENRIQTAAVSSFPRHPSPWFYHLWHEFYHPQEPQAPGEYFQTPRGETVADLASSFVNRNLEEDFFLYVQFWDPHAPYNRSDAEVDQFRDVLLPPYPTAEQLERHKEWDTWRSPTDPAFEHSLRHGDADTIETLDDLREMHAHYNAEINYVDQYVGSLLDQLKHEDLYDETFVVITADHGEEFGEHGLYREHWSTYDGTQRVPLLIKPPASTAFTPGARDQLVTNVDIAPTLADYAELDEPAAWQGRSLRPVLTDEDSSWRNEIVFDHGLYTAQRAIRTDRWKLIRTYHPGQWEEQLPKVQLFDMNNDPWEQNDVAADHPEVVTDLTERMTTWAEQHSVNSAESQLTTWGVDTTGRTTDALKVMSGLGPTAALRLVDN